MRRGWRLYEAEERKESINLCYQMHECDLWTAGNEGLWSPASKRTLITQNLKNAIPWDIPYKHFHFHRSNKCSCSKHVLLPVSNVCTWLSSHHPGFQFSECKWDSQNRKVEPGLFLYCFPLKKSFQEKVINLTYLTIEKISAPLKLSCGNAIWQSFS